MSWRVAFAILQPRNAMKRGDSFVGERLLVCDLDGTLVSRDSVPEAVARACRFLVEGGWQIMGATGRILASAKPHLEAIRAIGPAILYDGARLMNSLSGEVMWEALLSPEAANKALKIGWNLPFKVQLFGDEKVFCRSDDLATFSYFSSLGLPVERISSPHVDEPIYRVIYYTIDKQREKDIGNLLEWLRHELFGLADVTMAGNSFIDIIPPGASKGNTLKRFLSLAEDPPDIIVAVGDHMNDLELLQVADLRIAISSAPPQLLEIAHKVIPPAKEAGFAELARWLLESDFSKQIHCKG